MIRAGLILVLIIVAVHCTPKCVNDTISDYRSYIKCSGITNMNNNDIQLNPSVWNSVKIVNSVGTFFIIEESKTINSNMITELDLSSAGTLVIMEHGFKDYASLTTLDLSSSSLAVLRRQWFRRSNYISSLVFRKNKLRRLYKTDMENLRSLTFADFSYNRLETIERDTFSKMNYLKTLIFNNNRLKSVDIGSIPNLQVLKLNNNLINIIQSNAFYEMPRLRDLLISNNTLRRVDDLAFAGIRSLEVLDLADNSIEEIQQNTFGGLSNSSVRKISLSSNNISYIASGAFHQIYFVELLILSRNLLFELSEDIFEGLNCIYLYLNQNNIQTIHNNTFGNIKELELLDLSDNKLLSLKAGIFGTNLLSLKRFSANNNNLTHLDSSLFQAIPNIGYFDVDYNNLPDLPDDIFIPLKNLKQLYLKHNLIEEFTLSHVDSLATLDLLSIEYNRLTYIPLNNNSFPWLVQAHVGGNPWQCPCLDEIFIFFEERNISYPKKYYFDGRCPVCVPTYSQHCEKNMTFVRQEKLLNIYQSYDIENCQPEKIELNEKWSTDSREHFVYAL